MNLGDLVIGMCGSGVNWSNNEREEKQKPFLESPIYTVPELTRIVRI